jgi:hypothetical protein
MLALPRAATGRRSLNDETITILATRVRIIETSLLFWRLRRRSAPSVVAGRYHTVRCEQKPEDVIVSH